MLVRVRPAGAPPLEGLWGAGVRGRGPLFPGAENVRIRSLELEIHFGKVYPDTISCL